MSLKINLGSGQRPFSQAAGWLNIDKLARPGMPTPDLTCDGAHLPFDDGSAELVVLHHVLEHFGCGEGKGLVEEAHRVLAHDGSLLVFVPELRYLCQRWLLGKLSTQVYMTNIYGAYMSDEEDRHRWGYDTESLRQFVQAAAHWREVKPFDWRYVDGADIAGPDFWILGLEAIK